ncbi:MAG: zf-TFIIB domain-containing protein [Deltaproteobacteria bacterium]|nr:zf-TFIIB domain-containing protein [Deltaproteobacteria bacterium]
MSTEAATLSCPACRAGGAAAQTLAPGASLEGMSCRRCGGTLLPTTGSERLLHEELALDRASLVDLAESFGGRRFPCPWCQAKMRSLILRGVDVDLCFHCGALWLDAGELEHLSSNRHRGLAPLPTTTTTTATMVRPAGTVRLDDRHPLARTLGRILRSGGVVVGAATVLKLLAPSTMVVAAAMVLGGLVLTRRRIVDVFPRARRLLRSRRLMPTDARDEDAERLDDRTFVVVRPLGSRRMAFAVFADSCGRTITHLGSGWTRGVVKRAQAQAKNLGAVVVVDPRLDRDPPPPPLALPVFREGPFSVLLQSSGPSSFWVFQAIGVRREQVFMMQNAVPARGDESQSERLALCFCIELPVVGGASAKMRLHDDGGGYTVIVGEGGDPLGAVQRRAAPRWAGTDWLTFGLAGRATRVHLVLPPLGFAAPFFDDAGARAGSVSLHHGRLQVEVAADVDADVRFACCVLAAHAALDAGRLIEGR